MANLQETASWDAGIYQIETTDPVLGGPNGIANAQAKALANRTAFLKQQIEQLNSGQISPSWIASQSYVQGELQKLDAKQSVRAATVANITLSGAQTIDGVTLTVGDRVLVKDQTTAAQNGIYLVAAQSWTRATDADNGTKLSSGARVAVEEGTVNAGKVWYLATAGAIAVGTTALLFADEHPVASQAQMESGTDDKVIVTPKKLRFGFSIQLGATGYIALPSWLGGLVIQWGTATANTTDSVNGTVNTFPMTFPSQCFLVVASDYATTSAACAVFATGSYAASAFRCWARNPAANGVFVNAVGRYIAIGN